MERKVLIKFKDWLKENRALGIPIIGDKFIFKGIDYYLSSTEEIELLEYFWNNNNSYIEIECIIITKEEANKIAKDMKNSKKT